MKKKHPGFFLAFEFGKGHERLFLDMHEQIEILHANKEILIVKTLANPAVTEFLSLLKRQH